MPHSVHFFLKMVEKGLWDGCSFPVSAEHLIKAAPIPYEDSYEDKLTPFIEAGLARPSFTEYNSNYAHSEYTLGFVASEGSNGFYINTVDNTDLHGPGGQQHNRLGLGTAAGDPCFGEVIIGRGTIVRISNLPTQDDGSTIRRPVGIRKATITKSSPVEKSWRKLDFKSKSRRK